MSGQLSILRLRKDHGYREQRAIIT
jgi:hypothetical protein